MRFLLRPGWIAFVVVVIGFVVACYTLLAPWQFDREGQRQAQERAIAEANATPPVPFESLVPGGSVAAADEWRQVTVTGQYLPADEALVRLRVVDGKPASEVLTPVRLGDGRVVVVDRGSITTDEGQTVPDFAPAPQGPVTLTGRLRVNETDGTGRAPLTDGSHLQIYAADSRSLAAATDLSDVIEGYVVLAPGQPGVLTPIPISTPATAAPFTNGSYALQWLTFGAIALIALGYFVRLEVLQRRGRRERKLRKAGLRDALSGRDREPSPDDDPATRR
jgi:cytochrome oxidase assembly protein ShyY1